MMNEMLKKQNYDPVSQTMYLRKMSDETSMSTMARDFEKEVSKA